ncbi:Putative disease resistance protein [Glycine soja]|nr:Putative disease resistance protein [Glycine soja]
MDAVLGKLLDELLKEVVNVKDRAVKFRATLITLESTLNKVGRLAKQIDGLNNQLNKPAEEMKELKDKLAKGKKLVMECSEIQWWNCCYKANYQEELEALYESIRLYFNLDMQGLILTNELQNQVILTEIHATVMESGPRRTELKGVCSPPAPPAFTVGLDVHLREMKVKLLNNHHHAGSVLTVTGTPGSGKSTLVKKFCCDEEVKGIFKENIFFITFAQKPKLNTIVQRLFQHNACQVPEFQSDDDAVYQLENLLKQIGKNPILLVLDDVPSESVSLVDKFVFQIPKYKILVTSRITIRGFDQPYVLKSLNEVDAINLFRHSASLNQSSSDIPENIVKKIARGCSGSPLALIVTGKSLSREPPWAWNNRAKKLSKGQPILAFSADVLTCLQKSFDDLDPKVAECFRDLSLFPEAQRIPAAALVDIWAELRDEDDDSAMENIYELVKRNMADIVVTRNISSGTIDYNYHYVTQHGLLRDLAILQTNKELMKKRNRLIIDVSGNNLPDWWTTQNEYHIAAHSLSISTDDTFTSEWCNLQASEVEVLVLNLREKKRSLPMFMEKMNKLKVLIVTNYEFYRADLENFELLDNLSSLKRIRLEKVSIPFLSNTGVQLKNLHKFSFFMCNVNEAFKNSTIQVSKVFPNLEEMNIDYCDMVELPIGLSDIVSLKKLSITNCHKLSALPEGIGKLVNLESLRLTSCTKLEELPESITSLSKLNFLDISDCVSLSKLPENMGELRSLENLNCRGCTRLTDLPYSITELESLSAVVCDEETAALWEPFKTMLRDLKLKVAQVDFNLNWLS